MNTQKTVAETIPYEAPQMTIVPIRTSGMLCTSGGVSFNVYTDQQSNSLTIRQSGDLWDGGSGSGGGSSDSYTPGNSASGAMTSLDDDSGWGSRF